MNVDKDRENIRASINYPMIKLIFSKLLCSLNHRKRRQKKIVSNMNSRKLIYT